MGFFSKLFGDGVVLTQSELELEAKFLPMIRQDGHSEDQARELFRTLLKDVKKGLESDDSPLPSNLGDYFLAHEHDNENIKALLMERRRFGVTDEDIKAWWNMDGLERGMLTKYAEVQRLAVFSWAKDQGMSTDDAATHVYRSMPVYGDKDLGKNLPWELKWKVDAFLTGVLSEPDAKELSMSEVKTLGSVNEFVKKTLGLSRGDFQKPDDIITNNLDMLGKRAMDMSGTMLELWNKQAGIRMNPNDFNILHLKNYLFLTALVLTFMENRGYGKDDVDRVKGGLLLMLDVLLIQFKIADNTGLSDEEIKGSLLESFFRLFSYDSLTDRTERPMVLLHVDSVFDDLLSDHIQNFSLAVDTMEILKREVETLSMIVRI